MPVRPFLLLFLVAFLHLSAGAQNRTYNHLSVRRHALSGTDSATLDAVKAVDTGLFGRGSYAGKDGYRLQYRLLKPAILRPGTRYPLVIVYHGSGAVGTDNTAQLGLLAKLWAAPHIRNRFPAYVLVPQFPERSSNYEPDPARQVLSSHPQRGVETSLQLIDSLKKAGLSIDPKRIYAMGFSMGASTVVNALAMRPHLFAAGIAYAGIPAFADEKKLLHQALWLIHGNADTENPYVSDSLFYREMMGKGAKKLSFWQLDGVAHEVLPQLIVSVLFPDWLFGHHR